MRAKKVRLFITAFLGALFFFGIQSQSQTALAQGSVNVTVTGVPPIIEAPFTDQLRENFRNGRYQVIFTYNSSNSQPVDFRFRFSLSKGGKELMQAISRPESFRPGAYVFTSIFDELPFPQTFEEILDQVDDELRRQVVQEGTIPEGSYMLNIEAIPEEEAGMIASAQSMTPFTVRYPQPPILINPSNNSNLTLETPVFNWTPVAGLQGFPIQYDFLLVEVYEQQTPLQALNSNRVHAERNLINQNTLVYTPEFLPLEEDKQYVWQITASTVNRSIPLKNDGESEFQTFTYRQGAGNGLLTGIDGLQSIPLVPDYARLINLQNLEVDEQANAYALNGRATIELDNGQVHDLPVEVNNLLIQKGSPDNPNIMGGAVYASGDLSSLPILNGVSNIVDFIGLRWVYDRGVEATGKLQLPNGLTPEADGWIQLTSQGLSGQLVAENPNGVIAVGGDPVKLTLNRFEASFPERQLYATGKVDLFNGQSTCELTQLNVLEQESEAVFNCPDDVLIELVKDSAQLQLLLDNLSGVLDYNFETDQFAYDLTANGNLALGVDQAGQCSAYMQVTLDDVDGFAIAQVTPTCSVYAPPLDLGFMKLKLDDIDLQRLGYNGSGNWDFGILLEGALTIPAMDDWTMPLSSVNITSQGLEFPDLDWEAIELGLNEPLAIEGFKIEPTRFTMPQFTFPWFDWTQEDIDDEKTGDWSFNINFDFELPDFSDPDGDGNNNNILPPCVAAKSITGIRGGFQNGEFSANIPATLFRDCRVELADQYTFIINELGGELTAEASASALNLESEIALDAQFEAGYPFNCGEGEPVTAAQTQLTMNNSGLLEGSIDDIVNQCQVELGPFRAGITASDLIFEIDGDQQQLAVEAGGELALNSTQKVDGSLIYDVLNGEFDELDFTYNDPFLLNLPSKQQTVLSFLVQGLSLSKDGILINGRHQFVIGDPKELSAMVQNQTGQKITFPEEVTTIDVTFDNTLIGLKELGIKSGRIIFDEAFALKAGVDQQTTDISFSVSSADEEIELDANSLYAKLGGSIIIDKDGLHSSGTAEAGIRVGDLEFDDIAVDFKNRFAMGLQPFAVQRGQADLLHQSRRIAYVNSSGFHFDPSYLTQAIPDTIPLPTKDAAYLVLRNPNSENLLVQAQQESDGTYTMSTINPVDLVIPAIQGTQPQAPSVGVNFTDITYDPGSGEITAGAIEGNFNPAIDLNEIGVPLRLKRVRYDDGVAVNDQSFGNERGLFLQGDLLLYEQQVGDQGSVALYLENGNRLRGDVDLSNLNSNISLVPQSNLAVLNVDSLQGSIDVPLDQAQFPDVALDMGGQLRFQKDDETSLAALNYRATYDDEQFSINAINQPGSSSSNAAFIGNTGFRIDKINTLTLSYRSATNDFDFRSELDFSVLMDLQDGDTLAVPLKEVAITENGFTIPDQTINDASNPVLNAPPVSMGPAQITLLEFRILQDITFNWFTGEGVPPSFEMDLDMTLAGLGDKAPQASTQSLSLYNVGYNQGVFTGSIENFNPQGEGMPVALGGNTQFNITQVSGGLINDGTIQNPVQGYDIELAGNLENPGLFGTSTSTCSNPTLNINLSREGGLVGTANSITPCGEMVYGPATIMFDPNSSLSFTFTNDTQSIVLDGSVAAEIEQESSPNITAMGNIEVDVINGDLINGSILVDDLFTYEFPQSKPLFTFRVQQARLDQSGLVFTGDAGLTFPNSADTARVTFTNFNIEPENDVIAGGSFTVQDSLAFEVGVSPVDWNVVDPSTNFTRNNAGRLLIAAGLTVDTNGLSLSGSSTASVRAGGESFPAVNVEYTGFQIGFSPTNVTAGRADFIIEGESSSFGYLDEDKFHLNLPGLITSVIPDTLGLPNRDTAYLVLGDEEGNRYELNESQSTRKLQTLPNETVELVIPDVLDGNGDPLKVQVAFNVTVDDYMKITSGSVALESAVDMESYLDIPLSLDSLNYDGNIQELRAAATVQLPSSLNGVELATTAVIGNNGFEQATISAGEYSDIYLPDQENVTPIAADTLGNGALAFYVRGLEIAFGQTNSLAFSGQLKSELLQDSQGKRTPIHYAAGYDTGQWDVAIDNGNLSSGIDLGFAQVEPIPDGNQLFNVTMNDQEFAVAFAGIISLPELLGDGFSLEVQQLKISTAPDNNGDYVTVNAQQNLPDQNFQLINGILDLTSTNTSVSLTNQVLAIQTSGSFDFYDQTGIEFENLEFRSDGTVTMGSGSVNLLTDPIQILSDNALVLNELSLGVNSGVLEMSAAGSVTLPKPFEEQADITISADTDGNVDVSGPNFIFDDGFNIGNNEATEFAIGSFATLELTGLGINLNFSDPAQTSLYAAGAVYIENDTEKRIMFGNAGNLQQDPGIKYTPGGGVEWNVSSSFDPESSPFSFDYEFFSVSVASINIETNATVDGEQVPFQAEIGGNAGLNIAGVGGSADFTGFKFSTLGVDDVGRIDGGGTFTLMDIISLELGSFDYQTASDGQPFTLEFAEGSGGADSGASVDTVQVTGVTKYLHFQPGSGGQALQISLGEGFSGGVEEVIYYQTGEGSNAERYFKIKNANLQLSDQAGLTVGMEFLQQNNGFALSVAGGGQFAGNGVVAAGSISTINNDLRFGIFVAANASVNILGIVEASGLGGGFYYRPTQEILNMTISGVESLDSNFTLQGDQPDVQNLKLAVLLYAKIGIGGVGNNTAISASALIQVTDQFTKIDATGTVLNQGDRFKAGLYLTILYTQEIVGIEGGVNMKINYRLDDDAPLVMEGESEVDFFAKKDLGNDDPVMWGITGNFELEVLPDLNMLSVDGSLIVSSDGLLLELGVGAGFDIAIISADASFEMTVWYLPEHTDPFGIYGKFSISFSIVGGLAEFGASVEGGFFDRGSYVMIYFAGEAHVSVFGVIDANVRGWVRLQTQSPTFDYGRGGSAEMEQMIADAKDKANETKEKAEETKDQLDEAKDELNNALSDPSLFKTSEVGLRRAGYRMVIADNLYSTRYSLVNDVLQAERDLHGYNNIPDIIEWIAENVMQGQKKYGGTPSGYSATRERPQIRQPGPTSVSNINDISQLYGTQAYALQQVQNDAPPVQARIDNAITELGALSDQMRTSLEEDNMLSLENPVNNIQDATTGGGGELVAAPSFGINTNTNDSNKSKLETFESDLQAADQRYRDAIKASAANIELVDLVVSGEASISWGPETGVQLQPSQGVSVNDLAYTYTSAVREVRDYNSELIGSYWNMRDWAQVRFDIIDQNQNAITQFARKINDWSIGNNADVVNASQLAAARKYAISAAMYGSNSGSSPQADSSAIGSNIRNSSYPVNNRETTFKNSGEEFWYDMMHFGLQEVVSRSTQVADSLQQVFDQKVGQIESKHQAFTESVDRLYAIKSEMLVTVYGMIEEYNAWRQEAFSQQDQTSEAPFTDKVQEIEQALAPPTIDFISGKGLKGDITDNYFGGLNEYRDFYGIARLSYQASHAQGIPEMSYSILDGTVPSVYLVNDYYSAGVWNSATGGGGNRFFEMKFPKENIGQTDRNLTGVVRARGTGGTTVARFVNFIIPVGPGGTIPQGATIVEMGDDTSPPTKPVVSHNYESDANNYWTPDSTQLSFTFKSTDNESDVRLYKYKIGTTPGGNDVRTWTDAQGARGTGLQAGGYQQVGIFYMQTYNFTSTMQTVIRGLTLASGTDYYLSVKSVNGDNMESAVKDISKPFRYEPTPPSRPEITITPAPSEVQRQQAPTQPVLRQAVMDTPGWNTDRVNSDLGANNRQEFTFSWSANDPESGIEGFSVGTAYTAVATESQVFRADDVDFIPVTQATEFSYSPTFSSNQHLYVRARNKANMRGSMRVIGPIRNVDITPPTTPDVSVQGSFDGFNIYVTQLSEDGQTGIKGYQYAVFNSAGTDTIRSWPNDNSVDFELPNNAANQAEPSVKFIPWGALMQPGTYRVSVRAVNTQDMVSREVINTDVLYDNTPPQRTVFEPTFNYKTDEIVIRLIDYGDRESGLKSMRYRIVTNVDIDPYVSDPNNKFQPLGYDEKGRHILAGGDILNFGERKELTVVFQDLPYFVPVYLQITVQNNAGLERQNEVEIKIPPEIIKQFQQMNSRTK